MEGLRGEYWWQKGCFTMAESLKAFDKTDYEILKMLHEDCWVTVAEIARTLKINERTAKRRLTRLKETGAIRPTVIVEPDVFGYTTIVDVELFVDSAHYDEVVEQYARDIAISYLSAGWGNDMNLLVQARFKNSEEMHRFINETLPGTPGVTVRKYDIVPKIHFNTDKWMPAPEDFKSRKR